MREGVLLEESDPQSLLLRYNCSSLEEAFLYLCSRQSKEKAESDQDVSKGLSKGNQTKVVAMLNTIFSGNVTL